MNKETINEIKTQFWKHLQHIRGRLEELSNEGIFVHDGEWVNIQGIGRRNRWWLIDQLYFCQSEIEYWKTVNPDS